MFSSIYFSEGVALFFTILDTIVDISNLYNHFITNSLKMFSGVR